MTRSTGFPPDVRQMVLDRCGGRCELCGANLHVLAGSVHHRRPRRMGGDRRPETSRASNGLAICGSGVDGCHGKIENQLRKWARDNGVILGADQHPAEVPVLLRHGMVFLTDDGNYAFEEGRK